MSPYLAISVDKKHYLEHLKKLQLELIQLQHWVATEKKKVVILFEGRDAAGKGGVIKAISERLNPRIVKIVALGKPDERERDQWYFQRYVEHLPASGEIVLFDRSWYNRAGVEKVMGFCTESEYQEFLRACPDFERMLIRSDIYLLKYWFTVSANEQEKRFKERLRNPLKRWKFSQMDLLSREHWQAYSHARNVMLEYTHTPDSPWFRVNGDNKYLARLNCISHLLSMIPYQRIDYEKISLPKLKQPPEDIALPDNVPAIPDKFTQLN